MKNIMKNNKCLMTACFLLCVLWLVPLSHLNADIYIKGAIYFKSRYAYGITEPDGQITMEWWLGKEKALFVKAALTNSNDYQTDTPLKLILDHANQRMILLDDKEKVFVSIPNNTPPVKCMAEKAAQRFSKFRLSGWVKPGAQTASHLNTACRVVKVNETVKLDHRVYYDKDRTLLVADALPFDWKPLARLNLWMRTFFNPAEPYMNQLRRVNGFIMASEDTRYDNGKAVTNRFEILEINEKKPPKGIYDIPPGYKEKTRLTGTQVWGLFDTLYPWGW